VTNADDGYDMLVHWAAKRGKGVLQVVGPMFRPEEYGIAVAPGSPLRKQASGAFLNMYADWSYEDFYAKWFSQRK
jgi:polar amino acid transport system substrate-binding protein